MYRSASEDNEADERCKSSSSSEGEYHLNVVQVRVVAWLFSFDHGGDDSQFVKCTKYPWENRKTSRSKIGFKPSVSQLWIICPKNHLATSWSWSWWLRRLGPCPGINHNVDGKTGRVLPVESRWGIEIPPPILQIWRWEGGLGGYSPEVMEGMYNMYISRFTYFWSCFFRVGQNFRFPTSVWSGIGTPRALQVFSTCVCSLFLWDMSATAAHRLNRHRISTRSKCRWLIASRG